MRSIPPSSSLEMMGFGFEGVGFRVWGFGLRVVWGLGLGVLGFWV